MPQDYSNIRFPGWEVVKKLGEGSFGGVYEIMRTLPDRTIERSALKILTVPKDSAEIDELRSLHYDTQSITAHFRNQMQDLVKEYSLMQKLGSNPNVVHCQDLQTIQHEDGIGWDIYIRMELLTPLKQYLKGTYRETDVLRLAANMCSALNACHQRNIIHRDIKPENILVSPEGNFKLGDFGIAKITEKTATGTLTGTYSYMAPEVANRRHYGPSADIYSLGLVMYWMMNERTLPFLPHYPQIPTAAQKQEAQERRFSGEPLPEPLNGSMELKEVVLKACACDPKERYHSVLELMEDLRACNSRQRGYQPHSASTEAAPPKQEYTAYGNRSSNKGEKTRSQTLTSSVKPPVPAPLPPKPRLFPKIIAALTIIAVMGAAAILGINFVADRLNDQAVDPSTPPSAVPATQSGVLTDQSNMMKAFVNEDSYFWGQTQIKRQEIQKIVFTKEPITGTYSWDVSEAEDGSIMACVNEGTLYVFSDGQIKLNTNSSFLFYGFESVEEIAFNGMVDTSEVKYMCRMFEDCWNLARLDLSDFNTANTTDMHYMFYGCWGLTTLDLSSFNTQSVENMSFMFFCCRGLTTLDLSSFHTANVTNMSSMFSGCSGLTSLNLSSFHTANVREIWGMFEGCSGLTSLDLSGFNTTNVTDMGSMFHGCSGLKTLDLSNFHTANVTNMYSMFSGCSGLTSLNLSSFNTASVTDMRSMFSECNGLTALDVSVFNTASVTDMGSMFYGCTGLTSLDLSSFNTASVTHMDTMFYGCSGLSSLNLSGFNTASVTDMGWMFYGCSSLTSLDLSGFDTANVQYMSEMFAGCSNLTNLNLSGWDRSKADTSDMFSGTPLEQG